MNATGLMIGDWVILTPVQGESFTAQVEGVRRGTTSGVILYNKEWYHETRVAPIPLTYGILEKNGFRATVGPGGLFQLALEGLNVRVDFNIVRYIHQLQHALRLCGIDKEITL